MEQRLRDAARDAIGFMPENEGLALYEVALRVSVEDPPLLEIGSYCGKATIYLAAAAKAGESVVFTIDHHRGSEEHQPGEEFHDPRLVDRETGVFDSFPTFRRTIEAAGLTDWVVPIVASSETAVFRWFAPLGLVFIDGGHSRQAAWNDLMWAGHVVVGGVLAIHDVFPDPKDGGRPPFEIYDHALKSGEFKEVLSEGSLRVLERVREPSYSFWEGLAAEEA